MPTAGYKKFNLLFFKPFLFNVTEHGLDGRIQVVSDQIQQHVNQDPVDNRLMELRGAVVLWPKIVEYTQSHGHEPSIMGNDPNERRLAEGLAYIKRRKQEAMGKV